MIKRIEIKKTLGPSDIPGIAGSEQLVARLFDRNNNFIAFDIVDVKVSMDRTSILSKVDIQMSNGQMHIDDAEVIFVKEFAE